MRLLRIALAQLNLTVGDLDGNFRKMQDSLRKAKELKVDVLAFPELTTTGYPPEDLLLKPQFIEDNLKILDKFVKQVKGLVAVVGFIDKQDDIYDAAAVIYDKKIRGIITKCICRIMVYLMKTDISLPVPNKEFINEET